MPLSYNSLYIYTYTHARTRRFGATCSGATNTGSAESSPYSSRSRGCAGCSCLHSSSSLRCSRPPTARSCARFTGSTTLATASSVRALFLLCKTVRHALTNVGRARVRAEATAGVVLLTGLGTNVSMWAVRPWFAVSCMIHEGL